MSVGQESLEEVLREDEKTRTIDRVVEVNTVPGVDGPGENFCSTILRANLSIVLTTGKKSTTSLILKEMQEEGINAHFLKSHHVYETELRLYKEILPLLEEVLKEQGIPALWPKFLGQKGNYLIFEDLKNKNYRVADRLEKLDLEHALLAIRTLALFHAASVVLKDRGQLDMSSLPGSVFFRNTPPMRKFQEYGFRTAAQVILHDWGSEWEDIGERLLMKSTTFREELRKLAVVDEGRLNVLCHGDSSTNNIFFKYSKSTDYPIGLKFVDFQLSHYNSYGFDLVYFLMTSVRVDIRRNSTGLLLENYTMTLRESLKFFNLGGLAPSLETVQAELQRLEPVSLYFSINVLPVVSTTAPNPLSFEALYKNEEVYNPDIFRGKYKEQIDQELLYWARKRLF